jgi:YVTN family beta-propeller protein
VRKRNPYTYIFILFLALISTVLTFKDRLHSETDTTDIPFESNPRCIAINPVTDIAVVANEKSGSVSIVDLNNKTVLSTISVGKKPREVAIDNELNVAVVGSRHDNTLSVIDLNTFQVIATITIGKKPEGIAIDSSTHIAYVVNNRDKTVSVVDLMNYSVIETIPVGKKPKDIAIDPELNLALVIDEKSSGHENKYCKERHEHKHWSDYTVSVIDLNAYQVTGTISVWHKPQVIDINPETHLAVVANEKDNSITVIDLQTWTTSTIPIKKHPIDVVINKLDNSALLICKRDRSLLLIDLDTKTIIKNYSLNKKSKGVAVNNFTNIAAVIDDKTDSLRLIHLPNPVPEILSITPENSKRGGGDISISIDGRRFITSSIAYFESQPLTTTFVDNNHIQATIKKEMLLRAGIFSIKVKNPEPEGGISNSLYFTVNNPVPSISAVEPADAIAGTQSLTLNIHGTDLLDDTEVYFNGLKKLTKYISNTKLQIALTSEDMRTPGQYEIMAYNSPPGGGNSNKVIFIIRFPLEIEITSPSGGDTINKERVMVKGTIKSDNKDIGITVNGIIAEIVGNEWIANDVLLTAGENTITAVATDIYGNTDTKTVTVYTNDVTQTVKLSANITSGIAPLTTYFTASTSFTPVSYQMDFEGDGVIDYSGTTFEDITYTYTTEGIFYPTLTVIDDQGNTYSDTIAITVLNKTEIDTLLKGKWEGMKGALAEKNIENALQFFVERSKESYSSIFEALKDQLPVIMGTFIEFNIVNVFENIAEYEIVTNENGQLYSYPGIFIRGGDGIWKFKDF